MNLRLSLAALLAILTCAPAALAAPPSPSVVEQRVHDAAAMFETSGFEVFCAAASALNGPFPADEAYVFALLLEGGLVCHPRPDLLNVPTGARSYVPDMWRNAAVAAPDGAWTDYPWPHPDTRQIGEKSTYCKISGPLLICAGAFFGGRLS